MKIFGEHRDTNCKKDLQSNNLSKEEAEGLESLQKKIQKKEMTCQEAMKLRTNPGIVERLITYTVDAVELITNTEVLVEQMKL